MLEAVERRLSNAEIAAEMFVSVRTDINMHHRPRQMPALGHPTGMPDQAFRRLTGINTHQ